MARRPVADTAAPRRRGRALVTHPNPVNLTPTPAPESLEALLTPPPTRCCAKCRRGMPSLGSNLPCGYGGNCPNGCHR